MFFFLSFVSSFLLFAQKKSSETSRNYNRPTYRASVELDKEEISPNDSVNNIIDKRKKKFEENLEAEKEATPQSTFPLLEEYAKIPTPRSYAPLPPQEEKKKTTLWDYQKKIKEDKEKYEIKNSFEEVQSPHF